MNRNLIHLFESAVVFVLGFLASLGFGALLLGTAKGNYRGLIICIIGALLFLSGLIWFCTAKIVDAIRSLKPVTSTEEKVEETIKDETNPL